MVVINGRAIDCPECADYYAENGEMPMQCQCGYRRPAQPTRDEMSQVAEQFATGGGFALPTAAPAEPEPLESRADLLQEALPLPSEVIAALRRELEAEYMCSEALATEMTMAQARASLYRTALIQATETNGRLLAANKRLAASSEVIAALEVELATWRARASLYLETIKLQLKTIREQLATNAALLKRNQELIASSEATAAEARRVLVVNEGMRLEVETLRLCAQSDQRDYAKLSDRRDAWRKRAEDARAENAALKARIAELEAQLAAYPPIEGDTRPEQAEAENEARMVLEAQLSPAAGVVAANDNTESK